jgi:hypothetical protein
VRAVVVAVVAHVCIRARVLGGIGQREIEVAVGAAVCNTKPV